MANQKEPPQLMGFHRPMHRRRVAVSFPAETLTEQSHKHACDVNNIMARYTATGVMEHVRNFEPVYADMTEGDYHDAMNAVASAKSMFEDLPSTMRRHFGDDPARFLAFCQESEDPAGELQALAEGYRKQALGIDSRDDSEIAEPGEPPAGQKPDIQQDSDEDG